MNVHRLLTAGGMIATLAIFAAWIPASAAEPKGKEEVKGGDAALPCVADTHIACFVLGTRDPNLKDSEQGTNAGKTKRLKIKKNENLPVMKFDFSKVPEGATITEATLVLHMLDNKTLNHVGFCSLHVDWAEGDGVWDDGEPPETKPNLKHSGACFLGPKGVNSRWRDYDDSDFTHAIFGNAGNATGVTRARSVGDGKLEVSIDPYVVMAMRQDGQTLVINDETGVFSDKMDNQFFVSREGDKDKAPALMVKWAEGRDSVSPKFKGELKAELGPFAGSVLIHIPDAGDDGETGVALGYSVTVDGKPIPRALIPRPARKFHTVIVRDLKPGQKAAIAVEAFDEAGNKSEPLAKTVQARPEFPGKLDKPLATPSVRLESRQGRAQFTAAITDGMTLYDPVTGLLVRGQERSAVKPGDSLRIANAVRGEILGLQLLVTPAENVQTVAGLKFTASDFKLESKKKDDEGKMIAAKNIQFFREHCVFTGDKKDTTKDAGEWVPDILPEIPSGQTVDIPSQENITSQKLLGIYVDILVPKETAPGAYAGTITVSSAQGGEIVAPLAINVRDIVLPDALTFDLEMNAYGMDTPASFHAIHRLCHLHRVTFDAVPYGHTRGDYGTAPILKGKGKTLEVADWGNYDKWYGPLLSGELFKDLPRSGQPVAHLYLMFQESWPVNLQASYPIPDVWKGRVSSMNKEGFAKWCNNLALLEPLTPDSFSEEWREGNKAIAEAFQKHFKEKGWDKTELQIFSNHKYYFESKEPSLSLWTSDEPSFGRDFRALNFLYSWVYKHMAGEGIKPVMRGDISRPEWQGDRLDDAIGVSVISGSLGIHIRLVNDLMLISGLKLWWYGGGGGAGTDPVSNVVLFIQKWAMGCDGGLPNWLSTGDNLDWNVNDSLRFINIDPNTRAPVASFRLKAFRRGQQDIELLNALSGMEGFNRWHVAILAAEVVPVTFELKRSGPDDPGRMVFKGLDNAKIDQLREMVIATILKNRK